MSEERRFLVSFIAFFVVLFTLMAVGERAGEFTELIICVVMVGMAYISTIAWRH